MVLPEITMHLENGLFGSRNANYDDDLLLSLSSLFFLLLLFLCVFFVFFIQLTVICLA